MPRLEQSLALVEACLSCFAVKCVGRRGDCFLPSLIMQWQDAVVGSVSLIVEQQVVQCNLLLGHSHRQKRNGFVEMLPAH
jgi:hypothetical protein